jgi:hypothetical protein
VLLVLLTKLADFTGRQQVGKLSFEQGDGGGSACVQKMLKAKQQQECALKVEESGFIRELPQGLLRGLVLDLPVRYFASNF